MKIRLIAKTNNGNEALEKLYSSKDSMALRISSSSIIVLSDQPYTLEIGNKRWKQIPTHLIKNNKYIFKSQLEVWKSVLSDFGADENDFEMKVV